MTSTPPSKVLLIGATGFLGRSLGRAYVTAGWDTYGLVRAPKKAATLAAMEVQPILGDLEDVATLSAAVKARVDYLNAIVVTVEDLGDYINFITRLIELLRGLSQYSNANGVRPVVILTSGMKDYGPTALDGASDLYPLREDSPMNTPAPLQIRAEYSHRILEQSDLFDGVLVRPPNLYGLSGSAYAYFFQLAEAAKQGNGILQLASEPQTILHSMHVDDCAEAILMLTKDENRNGVKQQLFQMASSKYETLEQIGQALVKEYGLSGVIFAPEKKTSPLDYFILGFSQWISSEKIRGVTGWSEKRRPFVEAIGVFRQSYEACVELTSPLVQK